MLLAGDIGGTKVDLGVFSRDRGPRSPVVRAEFPSAAYPGLAAIAAEFLARHRLKVERACFAVAGPVVGGEAKVTNLPWTLDEPGLSTTLGLRSVHLMNDLEAIATGVIGLEPGDLHRLNRGAPGSRGTIAVIAPGTGLGEGFAMWTGSGYRAFPSEGGHADFAPADELQAGLLAFLRSTHHHVSVERVCSGLGFPNLYRYLKQIGAAPASPAATGSVERAADRTRAIIAAGLDPVNPDPLCRAAVDLFVAILGAEAGNLALKVLSTGGLYVAGGIPAHLLSALDNGRFMRPFTDKGRLSRVLERMPVHVVLTRAALIGAATAGLALEA